MKVFHRMWKRIFTRTAMDDVSPTFSYKIYWTKTAMTWNPEMRARVQQELQGLLAQSSFARNPYRRTYPLKALGEGHYSGESLACLKEVLEAIG
jgi:hypothetical protein